MKNIIWKPIEGALNYSVSNTGLVRRDSYMAMHNVNKKLYLKKEKILKPSTNNSKGYLRLLISYGDIIKTEAVHRLVAKAFIPNPEQKPQVNHIDGNKLNNNIENLEWVTNKENAQHGALYIKRDKYLKGSKVSWSKLKEEDVMRIPELLKTNSPRQVANILNVSVSLVHEITAGRTWRHLNLFPLRPRKCEKYFNELRYVPTTVERQETQ
jgi:hypothetical protein